MPYKNNDWRRRTISWPNNVDQLAVELAHDKRLQGGVSELVENLVLAEIKKRKPKTP